MQEIEYDTKSCIALMCAIVEQAVCDYKGLRDAGLLSKGALRSMDRSNRKVLGISNAIEVKDTVNFLRSKWPSEVMSLAGKDFPVNEMKIRLGLDQLDF